jgi:hypothetical protein
MVFNSGEEYHLNSLRFHYSFTAAICPEIQFHEPRRLAKSQIA